jgi:hypothetical protein
MDREPFGPPAILKRADALAELVGRHAKDGRLRRPLNTLRVRTC